MSAPFVKKLLEQIKQSPQGAMPLDVFMATCADFYYNNKDPLGTEGDFTTAPEISQMFGELIGLFVAQDWLNHKKDSLVVELGGGRGTLMSDLLRAAKVVDGFDRARQVYLIERSQLLRAKQKQNVPDATFIENLADMPTDRPLYLVANEFFDALPIRQFQRTEKGWQERLISANWSWQLADEPTSLPLDAPIGTIAETNEAAEAIIKEIARLIQAQGGMAVIIDYGTQDEPYLGDTLQAVKRHQFHPVFETLGEADITAHVRFARLQEIAGTERAKVLPIQTQKDFLEGLGIKQRAQMLAQGASIEEQQNISAALKRLTAPSQMGGLFKVMIITHA